MSPKQKELSEATRQALALQQDSAKEADRDQKTAEAEVESDDSGQPTQIGKRKRTALPAEDADAESEGTADVDSEHDSLKLIDFIEVEDSLSEGSSDEVDSAQDDVAEGADGGPDSGSGSMADDEDDSNDSDDANGVSSPQATGPSRTPLPVAPSRRVAGGSRYELADQDLDPRVTPGMNVLDLNRSIAAGSARTLATEAAASIARPRLSLTGVVHGDLNAGFMAFFSNSGAASSGTMDVSHPVHTAASPSPVAGPSRAPTMKASRKPPQAWSKEDTKRLMDLHESKMAWKDIVKEFPTRTRRELQRKISLERRKRRDEAEALRAHTAAAGSSKGKAPAADAHRDGDEDELGDEDDDVLDEEKDEDEEDLDDINDA